MAAQIEAVDLNAVISAAVDSANKMCNPDKWEFEWDWLENSLILNCRKKDGFVTQSDFGDACGYCRDLGEVIEDILRRFDDEEWSAYSELWVWDKDHNEIEGEPEDDELASIDCVQQQFFHD